MDNSRETNQVIFAIQKATFLMDPFFKAAAMGTVMLLVYLARLRKEGKLKRGDFKDIQEFFKATDGNYTILNVPTTTQENGMVWLGKEGFQKELAHLRKLGVRCQVLPDLNREDGFVQIAIHSDDRPLFDGWMERYLPSKMQGGEHSLLDLQNLTSGSTSIVSVPFEGKEKEIRTDFQNLKVNYALLPDLQVGDGEIQMMVANSDLPKVQHWFRLYQSEQLEEGKEVPDLACIDMQQYTSTGEMTEEQYVDTASPELQKQMAKYEREPGEMETYFQSVCGEIQNSSDAAYERLKQNPEYVEISIDHETLVNQMHLPESVVERVGKRGYFASRVPGTWGEGSASCKAEQCLLLPKENVFRVGTGYAAFLRKHEKQLVMDTGGRLLFSSERPTGEELYKNHYDKVRRIFSEKQQRMEQMGKLPMEQVGRLPAERLEKSVPQKSPKVPVKVK